MNVPIAPLAAGLGYLCGSISSARLVTRVFAPQTDISRTEFGTSDSDEKIVSGFVSATTVSMHLGTRLGFVTVVLDMLKIAIPTLVVRRMWPGTSIFLIAAVTAMIGHIWPLYYGFKGGRGLSAVYGGMFAIDWIGVFATSLAGMVFGLVLLRDVLVAYMAGLWFIIPWLWLRTRDLRFVAYGVAVNVIFFIAIIPEMKHYVRLRREGKGADLSEVMQLTGMGRGIYKMGRRLGLLNDTSNIGETRGGGDS
ncbi:MAG: glycerol-3-phosphate acyltransferase [Anaerolineae bacterium]|jgi:glycerol-3-phosphate acyltransferase PlsY